MTTTVRVFKNGRSQAIRLPREFGFEGDRVRVRRAGRGVLVEPMFMDVSAWFAETDRLATEAFTANGRQQPPTPQRDVFDDDVSNAQRLDAFFAGPLEWTRFDGDDAPAAGAVRAEREAAGTPMGACDVLRADQARCRGSALVTSHVKELGRVAWS